MAAAKMGAELGLPLADSVILATARIHQAKAWTQDNHSKNMSGVQYKRKQTS